MATGINISRKSIWLLFAGEEFDVEEQEEMRNGAVLVAVTDPTNPKLQLHPSGTFDPTLLAGQATALQEELKNGDDDVGVTRPSNPGLHSHPADTLDPLLLRGHLTIVQFEL